VKNLRILLVEDEIITAMLIRKQFSTLGCTCLLHVTTGENAIVSARTDPPDIILMDIRLAGQMDGIDAALVIKETADIPIIYITGYDDPAVRNRAEQSRPIGYLTKPLELGTLRRIIENHFQ
jgi:CheY-like chemotaxis protein